VPVIENYTGVLTADDICRASTAFVILDSIRRTSAQARRSRPDFA
jgi:hypothetical protein